MIFVGVEITKIFINQAVGPVQKNSANYSDIILKGESKLRRRARCLLKHCENKSTSNLQHAVTKWVGHVANQRVMSDCTPYIRRCK